MESFLLKTKECLYQTRQFKEKVAILKQKDDEFFVKEELAMAKNSSNGHLKRVSAILFWKKSFPAQSTTYKEYHSVLPSSELGLPPTPHPQASVPPPPCFWGEGNTRWRERGWESPNSDEGHTLW